MRRKKITIQKTNSRKISFTKLLVIAVMGVLAISSVFMTVETATSGVEVAKLREKENELTLEKRNLEDSLVKSLSMNDLQEKSNEMGYSKPTAMVYVTDTKEAFAKLP